MVNTGLGQFLSMADERVSTGGGPTFEVRFNVRLCVAENVADPLGFSPAKPVAMTVLDPLQGTTGN